MLWTLRKLVLYILCPEIEWSGAFCSGSVGICTVMSHSAFDQYKVQYLHLVHILFLSSTSDRLNIDHLVTLISIKAWRCGMEFHKHLFLIELKKPMWTIATKSWAWSLISVISSLQMKGKCICYKYFGTDSWKSLKCSWNSKSEMAWHKFSSVLGR